MPRKSERANETETTQPPVVMYKGFDGDLICRGHQFEIGGTYEVEGNPNLCHNGFHACESPLEVFRYGYIPSKSRYAKVSLLGDVVRCPDSTKACSTRISIDAEISLSSLIGDTVKWVLGKVDESTAATSGFESTAATSGDRSTAATSGDESTAATSGCGSTASARGENSVALSSGAEGRVSGAPGCALFLVERGRGGKILHAWAGIAGRDGTKPDTFYRLHNGAPVEVEA